jgi:hypothetical protein
MATEDTKQNQSTPTQTELLGQLSSHISLLEEEMMKALKGLRWFGSITYFGGVILAFAIAGVFLDRLDMGELVCFSVLGFLVLILGVWVFFKINDKLNKTNQDALKNAIKRYEDILRDYKDTKQDLRNAHQQIIDEQSKQTTEFFTPGKIEDEDNNGN